MKNCLAFSAAFFGVVGCTDPASVTANGGVPNEAECLAAEKELPKLLAEENPSRADLQALIIRSADNCVSWRHSYVVAPICRAYPDACTGQLEEELR